MQPAPRTGLSRTGSSRGSSLLGALGVAVVATLVLRAFGTSALIDDGPKLAHLLAPAKSPPLWYHALYLPVGFHVREIFGLSTLSALLWTSAALVGAGWGLLALALQRLAPVRVAWLLALSAIAAPGLWIHGTYVEVHSAQWFGAAALLAAAAAFPARRVPVAAALVAIAAGLAVTGHNSNLSLLPGAMWFAARREGATFALDRVKLPWVMGAGLLGASVGWWLNGLSDVPAAARGEGTGQAAYVWFLLTGFFQGPSLRFLADEWLLTWLPAWCALVWIGRRGLRSGLPLLAAGAPGLALFALLGIPTDGGYFASAAVFALGAAAAAIGAAGPARPVAPRLWLGLGAAALALWSVPRALGTEERSSLSAREDGRWLAVQTLLPEGGLVIGTSREGDLLILRGDAWSEVYLELYTLEALARGVDAWALAAETGRAFERHAAEGGRILLEGDWQTLRQARPEIVSHLDAIEAVLGMHFAVEPAPWPTGNYRLASPRASENPND